VQFSPVCNTVAGIALPTLMRDHDVGICDIDAMRLKQLLHIYFELWVTIPYPDDSPSTLPTQICIRARLT
jgi:hypothetical protein